VEETLRKHEEAETTSDPEYVAAVQSSTTACLPVPMPDCVRRSFAQIDEEPTVYHTMNGPSEFHVVGSLKTGTSPTGCTPSTSRRC
jgi:L-proline amide hydrolase